MKLLPSSLWGRILLLVMIVGVALIGRQRVAQMDDWFFDFVRVERAL